MTRVDLLLVALRNEALKKARAEVRPELVKLNAKIKLLEQKNSKLVKQRDEWKYQTMRYQTKLAEAVTRQTSAPGAVETLKNSQGKPLRKTQRSRLTSGFY